MNNLFYSILFYKGTMTVPDIFLQGWKKIQFFFFYKTKAQPINIATKQRNKK